MPVRVPFDTEMSLEIVQHTQIGLHTAQSGLFAGIFGLITEEGLKTLLLSQAHYYLFPTAAVMEVLVVILDAIEHRLTPVGKQKNEVLIRASINAVKALTIGVAVLGSLALRALLVISAPILFTIALGIGTIYQFARFIHHARKAQEYKQLSTQDPENLDTQKKYKMHCEKRKIHGINALISFVATVAVILVFGVIWPAITVVTIAAAGVASVASGIGMAMGFYRFFNNSSKKSLASQGQHPSLLPSFQTQNA